MLMLTPIDQHDLTMFLHLLISGLGMYALMRCWNATALGAVFAAIAWELCGYNAFWLSMEHAAIASAWLPLMMLGASLTLRKQSFGWAVATGAAAGTALLGGLIHHAYLSIVVFSFWYAIATVIAAGKLIRAPNRRTLLLCLSLPLVSALVALAVGAASWLSIVDVLSIVYRQPQALEAQLRDSIPLLDFVHALIRPVSASGPAGKQPDAAGLAFIGIPALILAPFGLLRRSVFSVFVVASCVISIAFALGFAPLLMCLRLLPYLAAIHPYSGFFISSFSIAALAGLGITEIGKLREGNRTRVLLIGLACVLVVAESWQLIGYLWATNPLQPRTNELLFPETPLIVKLQSLQGDYHILPVAFRAAPGQWAPPVLAGKVAADFGLRSVSGYESLLPISTFGIWSTVEHGGSFAREMPLVYRPYFSHDNLPLSLLEKTSVGLLVTPPRTVPRDVSGRDPLSDGTLQLEYQGVDGWVYRDTRALPRAFIVPRVVKAPDAPSALAMFVDQQFDARDAAIVIGDKQSTEVSMLNQDSPTNAFEATARLTSDRLNEVEVDCVTTSPAMMVLNDSWTPGWKAYVDGANRPVVRVNYAFRGVVVPEGQHRVLFLYRPTLLVIGLVVSTASIVMLFLLAIWAAARSHLRFLQH